MNLRTAVVLAGFSSAGALLGDRVEAATFCVSPQGSACSSSIQAAVDAAGPGDIVSIQPGTYYENVFVPAGKDGLQIVGASKLTVVLDAAPYLDRGRTSTDGALSIEARNVVVRNLTVKNAVDGGISSIGRGTVIQGVKVVGPDGSGISVSGWYSQILMNEVEGVYYGIRSAGHGTIVKGNTVVGTSLGILLDAASNQALTNRVYGGSSGIVALADGIVVKGNDVRRQQGPGITVMGTAPAVEGNTVEGSEEGIVVTCEDCFGGTVSANKLTSLIGHGIVASADGVGLLVQGNQLTRTGLGLTLAGVGITALLNKATDVGLDYTADCFSVTGSAHTLSQNTATGCAREGIFVNAPDVYLDRNVITGTFQNGIQVDGSDGTGGFYSGVILEGNKTSGSVFQGLAIVGGAVGTVVRNNASSKNRTDFCNDGTDTLIAGNAFGTITDSAGTDCFIMR